ncbi:MAG: hypothetical protein Q4E53_05415 [Eubacteriales bacterium]|nr:hypothetical protein [Eubacteriales bacterium]
MDKTNVRYLIEHRILPEIFFEDPWTLVSAFLEDESLIYRIFKEQFERNEMEMPYKEEDFKISLNRLCKEALVETLELPTPEREPLCYKICLFFNEDFQKAGYYCVEMGNEAENNLPFICSWDKNGKHGNHGRGMGDQMENILLCADHYMEKEFGFSRVKKKISEIE